MSWSIFYMAKLQILQVSHQSPPGAPLPQKPQLHLREMRRVLPIMSRGKVQGHVYLSLPLIFGSFLRFLDYAHHMLLLSPPPQLMGRLLWRQTSEVGGLG